MRLVKLEWQQSVCSRVKAEDEHTKTDAKVPRRTFRLRVLILADALIQSDLQ